MNTLNYIINKYKITVGHNYYIDIPEMVGGIALTKLFAELGFKYGVEIGTDQGQFAEVLCQNIPDLHLSCIDPWRTEAYETGFQPESNEEQSFFDNRYQETVARLKPYNCNIIRDTSLNALQYFPDDSLDFVYIDGNHDFLNVTQDIHYWLKKVKPGGIISGHDYVRYPFAKHNHVKRVVQAYAASYHMFPIFAVMHTSKGMRRDRFRSWFYVKQ